MFVGLFHRDDLAQLMELPMGMMTMARLRPIAAAVKLTQVPAPAAIVRLADALEQRRRERGRSKLARRLGRKAQLGRAGAF